MPPDGESYTLIGFDLLSPWTSFSSPRIDFGLPPVYAS